MKSYADFYCNKNFDLSQCRIFNGHIFLQSWFLRTSCWSRGEKSLICYSLQQVAWFVFNNIWLELYRCDSCYCSRKVELRLVSEISGRQSFPWYFALKMFPLPLVLAHDRVTVMLYNFILRKKDQMTIFPWRFKTAQFLESQTKFAENQSRALWPSGISNVRLLW